MSDLSDTQHQRLYQGFISFPNEGGMKHVIDRVGLYLFLKMLSGRKRVLWGMFRTPGGAPQLRLVSV